MLKREAGGHRGWAAAPQLGAVPCAYVLALSAGQDEEQALACQPLPSDS